MTLTDFLAHKLPSGLPYEDAAQLCMSMHCSKELCPPDLVGEISTLGGIGAAFSKLFQLGLVKSYDNARAAEYGAHFHDPADKGHWVEIIASIYKKGTKVDLSVRDRYSKILSIS